MSDAFNAPVLLSPHSLDSPRPGPPSSQAEEPPTSTASFGEILACVDGSELGRGVMPHAHAVPRALGARLTHLHVLETEAGGAAPADPLDWGIRQQEARAHLHDLAAQLGGLGSDVRSELIQGRAAEQICSWVEQHSVDLTVLCSHGARGVTDWDLASTARKLVDRTPGSLLLVPAAAAAKEEVRYPRILVPLDGSPQAESVVPIAMRIAGFEKAEVIFVHVVPVPEITRAGPLDAEGAELERRVVEHNHRVANAYLDRIRARASPAGVRVRALIVGNGSVRMRLERLIHEERANLVVMSAHGFTSRTDSSCGSVTEDALTHATTPLLIVRDRARHRIRRVASSSTRQLERLAPWGHATL